MESDTKDLTLLGNQGTEYKFEKPDVNILETFDNQHPDTEYQINFKCPEFTSDRKSVV